jgi:hypothetical protein
MSPIKKRISIPLAVVARFRSERVLKTVLSKPTFGGRTPRGE